MRLFTHLCTTILAVSSSLFTVAGDRCSAPEPDSWLLRKTRDFAKAAREDPGLEQAMFTQAITIPTYFHVLMAGNTYAQGNIPDDMLTRQLNALNEHYTPVGVSFQLKGITRTTNSAWFNGQQELAMKQALRKGGYDTLNVYFVKLASGSLGFCYFPKPNPTSRDKEMDGCVVLYTTTPGGSLTNYNQGKTVTHEVGHFMGLYHTFQGGCYGNGDGIADTPAQRSGTRGCPSSADTCRLSPGNDPIHNYMDYSYDSCMYEFTPNQITRMNQFYTNYRLGK